jgi:hypothetical protein
MRQAITTKYLGPTNSRGSRIKATAAAGPITIPYDYAGNADSRHAKAAKALALKLGWSGLWVAGGLPSEDGNVYVNSPNLFPHDTVEEPSSYLGREGEDWFTVQTREG